jgi:hypothetical protein
MYVQRTPRASERFAEDHRQSGRPSMHASGTVSRTTHNWEQASQGFVGVLFTT